MEAVHPIQIQPVVQSRIAEVDFNNIPFGRVFSDHMLVADYRDGQWQVPTIQPYGRISLEPSMTALHYGQSIFEGLKAYKAPNGRPVLFRPEANFERMNASAERLCMPTIPREIFLDGLRELIRLDHNWIPSNEGSSLYIRPFYFATDEYVGIKASDNYKFIIFTCPVGAYYPKPVGLMTTSQYVRAFPGGTGEAKSAGNYAGSLLGAREAKKAGFDNVLWLDGIDGRSVEECGTMNVWFIIDGVAVTPELSGTILQGTTRKAAMVILQSMGIEVQERRINIDEVWQAHLDGKLQEVFGTGTAATIAQVDRLGHDGTVETIKGLPDELILPPVNEAKVGPALLERLNGIRTGKVEDPYGWVEYL